MVLISMGTHLTNSLTCDPKFYCPFFKNLLRNAAFTQTDIIAVNLTGAKAHQSVIINITG